MSDDDLEQEPHAQKPGKRFGVCLCAALFVQARLLVPTPSFADSMPSAAQLRSNLAEFNAWQHANTSSVGFRLTEFPYPGGQRIGAALEIEDANQHETTAILSNPQSWCALMFLHLNVKSCVHSTTQDHRWVRLYLGRKFYQPPQKAVELQFDFDSGVSDGGMSWIQLSAEKGPYGTSGYYFGLFSIQTENDVYVEFKSSQRLGETANALQYLYFHTFARKKIGFSLVGNDRNDRATYVGGQQAMLERNIVRYLLALRVYLQTPQQHGYSGMLARATMWYDATEKFPAQLHEVERKDYLAAKTREFRNQRALQSVSDEGGR